MILWLLGHGLSNGWETEDNSQGIYIDSGIGLGINAL